MRASLFFFALAFLVLTGCAATQENAGGAKLLRPGEFSQIIQGKEVFVIDTHIPEQEHILGTDVVIPYNRLEEGRGSLPEDKDTPIAVYCRSGSMSAEAAGTLREMGYTTIYDLEGGVNAWREAGLPFEVNT